MSFSKATKINVWSTGPSRLLLKRLELDSQQEIDEHTYLERSEKMF